MDDAYCPRYLARYLVRGRLTERLVPLLATYVLLRFDGADAALWHRLVGLSGALVPLGGSAPFAVPEAQVAALRAFVGDGGPLPVEVGPAARFTEGDEVLVIGGPFLGHQGTCDAVDLDAGLVSVKISGLLGRECSVMIPAVWCEMTARIQQGFSLSRSQERRWRRRRGINRAKALSHDAIRNGI